jgi:capsular polysaccharide biosynthesis protein
MELNEVVRRIFGQHWRLIACFIALGVAAPALLHLGDTPTYTASARSVLDTQDPESRAEAAAIVDTARAIATSPGPVRSALSAAHVSGRDPVEVAKHHVSVRGLGSSGVFQLSVSDRDPRTAAAIANALAAQLIRARLAASQGQRLQVLADLGQEIDDLNARITYVAARIDSLDERLSGASGESAGALRADRAGAMQLRDSLVQQKGALEVQQNGVLSSESARPKATIISRAGLPTAADSSRFLADVVLGALLGLILGVGVAGIIETFRPTLVGGDALAREFRAPLLGTLRNEPDEWGALQDETGIGMRLRLAAEAAALLKVSLVPIGPQVNVGPLAEWLEAASSEDAADLVVAEPGLAEPVEAVPGRPWRVAIGAHAGTSARPAVRVRPFDVQNASASLNNGTPGGLVLVLPTTVKKGELMDAGHLLTVSRLPLLGLITYPRRRRVRGPAPA